MKQIGEVLKEHNLHLATENPVLRGGFTQVPNFILKDPNLSVGAKVAYRGLFYIKPDGAVYSCPNLEEARFAVSNIHCESLVAVSARLAAFHQSLRTPMVNDRYLCTGEREKYETQADVPNLTSLRRLRSALEEELQTTETCADEVAFCVSRNW